MAEPAPGLSPVVLEIDLPAPGPARPIPVPTTSSSEVLAGGRYVFYGFSLRETTGAAAATVDIYDGGGTGGTLVAALDLAQGASDQLWLGDNGVLMVQGIYLSVVAGSVRGAVYARRVRGQG
ncbi:MAG TPA: hypothetical protein VNF75_03480 [Candidatus Dormibacteraeota bacterium]|nr:hypothetical protein [Candidatus Dormibacteraeota bacterium]